MTKSRPADTIAPVMDRAALTAREMPLAVALRAAFQPLTKAD